MERETPEPAPPPTFLRGEDSSSARARFECMIRRVQAEVCAALEAVEEGSGGGAVFREDAWTRPGGGGGISRVLQGGRVFEKAAGNVSVVYGVMPPDAYRAARPEAAGAEKAGPVPFFAAGVSSVIHPNNPFAPTLHFNYRYFETEALQDVPGAPRQWWFGGGTDLTPSYIIEEDIQHFHSVGQHVPVMFVSFSSLNTYNTRLFDVFLVDVYSFCCITSLGFFVYFQVQKQACDKFDPRFYPRFKRWCDDYFHIKHRGERRGVGGIFFDDLNDHDQEMLLDFTTGCADSVIPAYIPILERWKDTPFTEDHRAWQQLRRGRYVEFNLVYDCGTTFGLKTGGRIASILVSLPLTTRWEYDHKPEVGTEEWKLLDVCINPKEWI